MVVDLDGSEPGNDTLDHSTGDQVLREVIRRLLAFLAPTDPVARLYGDEFAVILPAHTSEVRAEATAASLVGALGQPYVADVGDVGRASRSA